MHTASTQDRTAARLKVAELTSGIGAGLLGLGIGVLAASHLGGLGLPILLAGLLLHVWGMADKHRIESRQGGPRAWWSTLLYWVCWGGLAVLLAYAIWQRVRG